MVIIFFVEMTFTTKITEKFGIRRQKIAFFWLSFTTSAKGLSNVSVVIGIRDKRSRSRDFQSCSCRILLKSI